MVQSNLTTNNSIKDKILWMALIIYTFGVFTSETFISNLNLQNMYLLLTIFLLISYYLISNRPLFVTKAEILWSIFILYFFVNTLFHGKIMPVYIMDLLVFFMLIIFILLVKIDLKKHLFITKLIVLLTFIFALGSFFQYWFMDLYSKIFLPKFNINHQKELLMLYSRGSYTGFTWQTAFISGFLICGIGLLCLGFQYTKKNMKYKWISISLLLVMVPALFLGGKRAHVLFMIISLIVTYIVSVTKKEVSKTIITIFSGVSISVLGYFLILRNYVPDTSTPFGKFYYRFSGTLTDLKEGNDITSGRTELYSYALNLFAENPLIGIGWREFSQVSRGVIHARIGSHPHNIYIQLLTELGIIGLCLFLLPVLYTLIQTIHMIMKYNSFSEIDIKWKYILQFSLFYQIFFLLYGITGNLLTDHMYLLIYVYVSSITFSYAYIIRQNRNKIEKITKER